MSDRKPPYFKNPDDPRYQTPDVEVVEQYHREMKPTASTSTCSPTDSILKFHEDGEIEIGQWVKNARITQVRNYEKGQSNAGWFIELYPEEISG